MNSSGFIYVASKNPQYYGKAINSCASLKQFFPEAHVTLFTHNEWVDEHANIFDNIITNIPANIRAKMWCMARTPYEITIYIDADSLVQHPTVKEIPSLLGNNDFVYAAPDPEHAVDPDWQYIDKENTILPFLDGSFLLYRNTNEVINLLQDWYDNYNIQTREPWKHTFANIKWKQFDMFTIWAMFCSDPVKHSSVYKPEFLKYRKLKYSKINKEYNCAWFTAQKKLTRPLSIIQIEASSYKTNYNSLYRKVLKICENKNEVNQFS